MYCSFKQEFVSNYALIRGVYRISALIEPTFEIFSFFLFPSNIHCSRDFQFNILQQRKLPFTTYKNADNIGGLPLTCDQQIARPPEDCSGQQTYTEINTIRSYHGIILHKRNIPWQSKESNLEILGQYTTTLPQSQSVEHF